MDIHESMDCVSANGFFRTYFVCFSAKQANRTKNEYQKSKMIKLHSSRGFSVVFILCLCLGSLVISSMSGVAGLSVQDVSGGDFTNFTLLDTDESDEEFLIELNADPAITSLFLSKSSSLSLDFEAPDLSPAPPPPNHS